MSENDASSWRRQHVLVEKVKAPERHTAPILKIVPRTLWRGAEAKGVFDGAPVDLADGFIHFSTVAQVEETAARHFVGETDLLLIAVDPRSLGDALRWETSRNFALFPHLYAPLKLLDVIWAKPLPLGPDGRHDFTGLLG